MKLNQIECKSCGAHIKVNDGDENVRCPYCGNTYSVSEEKKKMRKKNNSVIIIIIIVVFIIMPMIFFIGFLGLAGHMAHRGTNTTITTTNSGTSSVENRDYEVFKFNSGYNNGTWFGGTVGTMLDRVVTSNKTNSKKTIVVKYKETQTEKPDEIIELKKKLEQFTSYEVILDYDNEGYINKITIEDVE